MEIFGKLPEDIIINHIMPYIYQPQPKILLLDIQSFYTDIQLLDNYYYYYYNNYCIYNDIVEFTNLENLISRSCICKNFDSVKLTFYVINNFHNYKVRNHSRKIRMLWGLMTRIERTKFINKHIIDEDVE